MMIEFNQEIRVEVIEVDIGGCLPIPLGPSPLFLSVRFRWDMALISYDTYVMLGVVFPYFRRDGFCA